MAGSLNDNTSTIVTDPTDANNKVLAIQHSTTAGWDNWGGFEISIGDSQMKTTSGISFRLWTPALTDVNTYGYLWKMEGDSPSIEQSFSASHEGSWETISLDFTTCVGSPGNCNAATTTDGLETQNHPEGEWKKLILHHWGGSNPSSPLPETIYLDDITFTTGSDVVVDPAPTDAPTAPSEDSSTVLSLFSDAYTDVSATWNPNWNQSTTVEDVEIANNTVKKYSSFNYSGIEPSSVIEVNNYGSIKLDFWTADATSLKVKFVDYGDDKTWSSANVEKELTHTISEQAQSSWQTLQLTLSAFNVPTGNIGQIVLTHVGEGTALVYFDNIYFSGTALSNQKSLLEGISVYPNPVSNRVSISAAESIDRLRIYDLTGRLVKQDSPHKEAFSVDVSGLSKGVYLVKLNAGDREATTKMIK